jgi:hypothetical protein
LVPIGVEQCRRAGGIQPSAFLGGKDDIRRLEIVLELGICPRTYYHRGHARPADQPASAACAAEMPRDSAMTTSISMIS